MKSKNGARDEILLLNQEEPNPTKNFHIFKGLQAMPYAGVCQMRGGMALECTKMFRDANFCH
jgi:hypothetical protein